MVCLQQLINFSITTYTPWISEQLRPSHQANVVCFTLSNVLCQHSEKITGLLSGGTFRQYYRPYFRMYFRLYFRRNHDETSWRETAIKNKQATAWLPHHEYNIDCTLSNLLKHFIMIEFPLLHVYLQISRAEAEILCISKDEFYYTLQF